jgi:PAS domain S-box-containing protein
MNERETFIQEWMHAEFARWLQAVSFTGAAVFLAFTALDVVAYPALAARFFGYRVVAAACLALTAAVAGTVRDHRTHLLLGLLAVGVSAATIEAMILQTGGHSSRLSTGMVVLAVGALAFIPWNMLFHGLAGGLMIGIYGVPIIATEPIRDFTAFFLALFFLSAVVLLMLPLRLLALKNARDHATAGYEMHSCRDLLTSKGEPAVADPVAAVLRLREEIAMRQATEQRLEASETKYRTLFESAPIGLYICDLAGNFIDGNRKAEEIIGCRREEAIGKSFFSLHLLPPWLVPKAVKLLACNAQGRATGPDEFELIVKGGVRAPVEISTHPVTVDGQQVILGMVRDLSERRKSEERLREMHERLEFLVASSPAIIHTSRYGGDWALTFVSDNAKNVVGYEATELLGAPEWWAAGIHPDDRDRVLAAVHSLVAQDSQAIEYRFQHKNGSCRWLYDRRRVVRDGEGRPIECVGLWLDITERRQAEEKLRESERRYRLLFNSGNDPIVVHRQPPGGAPGNFVEANELAYQSLGYSREELLRLSPVDIEDPADDSLSIDRLRESIRREHHVLFERKYLTRDGRRMPVEINARLFEWNGEPAVLSVVRDITERKRAEERLREQKVMLQTLIQAIPDVVFFKDAQNRYLMANQAAVEFMGLSQDQIVGKTDEELLPPELAGACRTSDEMVMKTFTAVRIEEQYLREGERVVLDTIKAPVFDALGAFAGLIGVSREVTERRQVEEDLRRSRDDIRRLNLELEGRVRDRTDELKVISRRLIRVQEEERRHLARELHDEVGQVLTGVKYGVEQLIGALPAASKDEGTAVAASIGDLLTSVRGLSLKLRPSLLDDFGLVSALKWDFGRVQAATGLQIAFRCQGEPRRFDQHAEIALYRIAQEAITNVVRHAGVHEATVDLLLGDETAVLTVQDRGAGFLTESWSILQDSTGLSGMSERSMLIGGKFSVDSRPGEGTRVTAVIPLRP